MFSILTVRYREDAFTFFLYKYIRETGHAPGGHVFDGSIFEEGNPVIVSDKLFRILTNSFRGEDC